MHVAKEAFSLDWDGPLTQVVDLPGAVVYGTVLTLAHTARFIPWESVRAHLKQAFGDPSRERKRWRGVEMSWERGKVPATVLVRQDRIRVKVHGRLSPTRLKRLVRALEPVPNVGAVRLTGQVQTFTDGTEASHPGRRPAWMDTASRFR